MYNHFNVKRYLCPGFQDDLPNPLPIRGSCPPNLLQIIHFRNIQIGTIFIHFKTFLPKHSKFYLLRTTTQCPSKINLPRLLLPLHQEVYVFLATTVPVWTSIHHYTYRFIFSLLQQHFHACNYVFYFRYPTIICTLTFNFELLIVLCILSHFHGYS